MHQLLLPDWIALFLHWLLLLEATQPSMGRNAAARHNRTLTALTVFVRHNRREDKDHKEPGLTLGNSNRPQANRAMLKAVGWVIFRLPAAPP